MIFKTSNSLDPRVVGRFFQFVSAEGQDEERTDASLSELNFAQIANDPVLSVDFKRNLANLPVSLREYIKSYVINIADNYIDLASEEAADAKFQLGGVIGIGGIVSAVGITAFIGAVATSAPILGPVALIGGGSVGIVLGWHSYGQCCSKETRYLSLSRKLKRMVEL